MVCTMAGACSAAKKKRGVLTGNSSSEINAIPETKVNEVNLLEPTSPATPAPTPTQTIEEPESQAPAEKFPAHE